jgi:Predicted membrane protein
MHAFDLHRMVLDKVPMEFLWEVALRSVYTFVLVFLFLKITGRRGVRQMSLFEVLIILTLGSAAGDVAFYDDVPMLPVLIVFVSLGLLYRLVMWLMAHSEKLEDMLEGKPILVVEDGELAWEKLRAENMTEFEFFMELRLNSIEHLGQVKRAILETNGQISVYFFDDQEVKPGLPILPGQCVQRFNVVPEANDYACTRCSAIFPLGAGQRHTCPRCQHTEWAKASQAKRIT